MTDVYDWWSRHPRALDVLYGFAFLGREARLRRESLSTLSLDAGERVVELGCGPGNSFGSLRAGVGAGGSVLGIDASRGMARAASNRAAEWRNVRAVWGDALRPPVPDERADAVYAAMSLSAMPEPAAAVRAAYRLLRPGGRFVVIDAQPFQQWPARALNAVAVPVSRWLTDWVPAVDLPAAVDETFDKSSVSTHNGGSIFIARGERSQTSATTET